jgi:hypothetical protein
MMARPLHVLRAFFLPATHSRVVAPSCRDLMEPAMPAKRPEPTALNLQAVLDNPNVVALRIEISLGMRAPIVRGRVELEACWCAKLWSVGIDRRQRPQSLLSQSIVDKTPAALLRQLAMLVEAGELQLHA